MRISKKVVRGILLSFWVAILSSYSSETPYLINNKAVSFRIMSYNIHYGRGADDKVDLQRIVNVIKDSQADIIGLNEVDRFFKRSGYVDQIKWIAGQLDMNYFYQPTYIGDASAESGNRNAEHGHAVLSKYPIEFSKPRTYEAHDKYKRGILESKILIEGQIVYFYVTHWSMGGDHGPRISQAHETVKWLHSIKDYKVVVGDLNATPDSPEIQTMSKHYTDAFLHSSTAYTFDVDSPSKRIDYIFGGDGVEFKNNRVIETMASDHLPVVCDVIIH